MYTLNLPKRDLQVDQSMHFYALALRGTQVRGTQVRLHFLAPNFK